MRLAAAILALAAAGAPGSSNAPRHGAPPDAGPSPASRKPRLAMQALAVGDGVDGGAAGVLELQLCEDIAHDARYDVICPDDIAALVSLAQETAVAGQCDDSSCLEALARVAHADLVVHGAVAKAGEGLELTLSLSDGKSGEVKRQLDEKLPADAEPMMARLPEVARKLLR